MELAWQQLPFELIAAYLENYFRWLTFERAMDWALRAFNIGLIWWIFFSNNRERKGERQRDSNKESRKFATQELILKPNLTLLTEFFDATSKRLKGLHHSINTEWGAISADQVRQKIEMEIADFKSSLDPVKARIVRPLVHLTTEFSQVSETFEKMEDLFTEYLQLAFKPDTERDFDKRANGFQSAFEDVIKNILDGQREFLVSVDAPPSTSSKQGRSSDMASPARWRLQWPLRKS